MESCKKGVAFGSKLGRNNACAYMVKSLMSVWWRANKEKPLFYRRFIDDAFGHWTKGEEALKRLHKLANEIHKDIKMG